MKTASVQEAVQRALEKVSPEALTGCWLWDGAYSNNRFGTLKYAGVAWKASRFLFTNLKEPINPGKYLLHSCDNEACVNPNHLRQGTQFDNMKDMYSRERQFKGKKKNQHRPKKLTEEAVKNIRDSSESQLKLAARYGVCPQTIHEVKTRKIWKHVS